MSIKEVISDDTMRHSMVMVAFTTIGAAVNYSYQVVLGWLLSPEDYGVVISLVSLLIIISVFALTIDNTVTKFISRETSTARLGRVNHLWNFFLKRTLILGILTFAVLVAFTPLISRFLAIENSWYPVGLFLSLVFTFAVYTNYGTLRGLQRFGLLGANAILWAFLKLAIAASLVYLGFRVWGALISLTIAYIVVFFTSSWSLRDLRRAGREEVATGGYSTYIGLTFLALLTFNILTNADVILARHYLSTVDAGSYAAISVMGKVVLFVPGGISIAMFPKTSRLFENGQGHGDVLWKSLLLTLLLAGMAIILYGLFPGFFANVIFLGRYPETAPYLLRYSAAMAFFSVVNLMMLYLLSTNRARIAYFLLAGAIIELGLIAFFHASVAQMINIMFISGAACLGLTLLYYLVVRNDINHHSRV